MVIILNMLIINLERMDKKVLVGQSDPLLNLPALPVLQILIPQGFRNCSFLENICVLFYTCFARTMVNLQQNVNYNVSKYQ